MKRIINYFLLFSIGVFLLSSCEDDKTYSGDVQFRLMTTSADFYIENASEGYDTYAIKVQAVGAVPSKDITLNLVVNTTGTDAVAGVDYNLPTTVTIPAGEVEAEFNVQGLFDGVSDNVVNTLSFTLTSDEYTVIPSYSVCNMNLRMVSPLTPWVGTYSGGAISQTKPGTWDELWSLTIGLNSADPANKLDIYGFAGGASVAFVGTVDTDAGTISFAPAQNLGVTGYGYEITVYLGAYNSATDNYSISQTSPVTGTVNSTDYSMQIDNVLEIISAGTYAGSVWDAFDVTVTRSSKSSSYIPYKTPSKL